MNCLSLDLVYGTNCQEGHSTLFLPSPNPSCRPMSHLSRRSFTLTVSSLSVFLQPNRDLAAQTCSPRYLEAEAGELQVQGLKMKKKKEVWGHCSVVYARSKGFFRRKFSIFTLVCC